MTRQRSLMSNYISVLVRSIETTKNDSAQLRNLVYELARMSLGKQILMRHDQIDATEMHQHLYSLEAAIKKVESLLEEDEQLLGQNADLPLIEGPIGPLDHSAVGDELAKVTIDDGPVHNNTLVINRTPDDLYYEAPALSTYSESSQLWQPAYTFGRSPRRDRSKFWFSFQLLIAVILGIAIYFGVVERSNFAVGPQPHNDESLGQSAQSASGTQNGASNRPEMRDQSNKLKFAGDSQIPEFDLPTVYGVYAENEGKLLQLASLPIRVPDPRVAISAMISKPAPTTIANGKIAFVVFRRDLVASAPDKVLIRIVARVAREIKFTGVGPAMTTNIDDQWAVRSNSYQFEVAPLDDNPEMILVRAAKTEFSLPAGRYALVLKDQAFDFNVAGQITDVSQCLERTDTADGQVYSECRKVP
jgi:hypothetical protein